MDWQEVVADPKLDRRFSTLFIVDEGEVTLTATFYGTRAEFEASGIPGRMPAGGDFSFRTLDWPGHLEHAAETVARFRPNALAHLRVRSRAFRDADLLGHKDAVVICHLSRRSRHAQAAQAAQAVIVFSSEGGAMADTAANATAYAHRDKVMMFQALLVDQRRITIFDRMWLDLARSIVWGAAPHTKASYAGYVDRRLGRAKAQARYWGPHVARLELLKRKCDPNDVFHNPQIIDPAKLG